MLYLSEQDVGGLSLGSAVSCCITGNFLYCQKGLFIRVT